MSESIYAPPEADVAIATSDAARFYVVAPRKFYLLSVLTFNLYLIYWSYKNWRNIKLQTGEDIWPPMRGFFYIFFTHALLTDIDEKIKSQGESFKWRPGIVATTVVLLTILVSVLDRLSANNIGSPGTELFSAVLVPAIPAFLLKAQHAVNFACDDTDGSTNSSLTFVNWLWMVLGSLAWLAVLVGVYILIANPELLVE